MSLTQKVKNKRTLLCVRVVCGWLYVWVSVFMFVWVVGGFGWVSEWVGGWLGWMRAENAWSEGAQTSIKHASKSSVCPASENAKHTHTHTYIGHLYIYMYGTHTHPSIYMYKKGTRTTARTAHQREGKVFAALTFCLVLLLLPLTPFHTPVGLSPGQIFNFYKAFMLSAHTRTPFCVCVWVRKNPRALKILKDKG